MSLFDIVNDWVGPFAETPNDFYQKCFEIFQEFMDKLQEIDVDGDIQYHKLTTKDIYTYLMQFQEIIATVDVNNPAITGTVKTSSWDYDLACK